MSLILQIPEPRQAAWHSALREQLPDLVIKRWRELNTPPPADWRSVRYALAWHPPAELLSALPRLEVIFSLGAGIDHMAHLAPRLTGVPVVRMVDEVLTEGMAEYVIYYLLGYHRHFHRYADDQERGRWRSLPQVRPAERRVGVLGLGEIGEQIARRVAALGFSVHGWSRRKKTVDGVVTHAGEAGFATICGACEVLVCVLPLTDQTRGILNAQCFDRMPRGGYIINIARGEHVVEDDLLAAIDAGKLAGAALDVFAVEPLPDGHPFWSHPKIALTPHIASLTNPRTGARHIAQNIRRYESSSGNRVDALHPVIDFKRGY